MMFRKEKKKFYCKTEDKFTKKQMQRILAGLIHFHNSLHAHALKCLFSFRYDIFNIQQKYFVDKVLHSVKWQTFHSQSMSLLQGAIDKLCPIFLA